MRVHAWTLPTLTLLVASMACSGVGAPLLTPTASAAFPATDTPPAIPPLTAAQVLNAEFTITAFDGAIHSYAFADGVFTRGTDPVAADYASIHIVAVTPDRRVVFGDLNRDGADDAVVILAENYGGTGVFVSVAAVLNDGGAPRHAASYIVDDRPVIEALAVADGVIRLDAVVHGPNDPGCCPEQPVTRAFRLVGEHLMLVGATSETPDGSERVITIDAPLSGAEASGALQLRGAVTVSPFENNLSYGLYGPDGAELRTGPLMVSVPELGGPGTFDAALDLGGLPTGPLILIVADFSAADGSVLALDAVELVLR